MMPQDLLQALQSAKCNEELEKDFRKKPTDVGRRLLNEERARSFPLYRGSPARSLYFEKLGEELRSLLQKRGYDPKSVFELPRNDPGEEVSYLLAKAQGIEEGTIIASEEQLRVLEFEMKANRMLGAREGTPRITVSLKGKEAREILASWAPSRHTLRGNSTVVDAQLLPEPIKGVKAKGKVAKRKG